jgi:hypothetical protein
VKIRDLPPADAAREAFRHIVMEYLNETIRTRPLAVARTARARSAVDADSAVRGRRSSCLATPGMPVPMESASPGRGYRSLGRNGDRGARFLTIFEICANELGLIEAVSPPAQWRELLFGGESRPCQTRVEGRASQLGLGSRHVACRQASRLTGPPSLVRRAAA